MSNGPTQKLTLFALAAIAVGSMIGSGILSLPGNLAIAAGPPGAIIAWTIAGGGVCTLARVFQLLAECKPELDAGINTRADFGHWIPRRGRLLERPLP
jgi:arginine:ornithine antiporter/lysine permease